MEPFDRAAKLCSTTEKCVSEIRQKLLDWGQSADEADAVIERLVEDRFIDEARYAHAFVHDKFQFEHWGIVKIRYALRFKDIDDSTIREALDEEIDSDEYVDVCASVLQSKLRGMRLPLSPSDKAKLYRFAAQRGFESSVISQALQQCI